jgi:methionyl-tRNA formyltransferase
MKLTNIILSEKEWNRNLISTLEMEYKNTNWLLVNNKNDFNSGVLSKYNIDKIFIPHWSYIIPEAIYSNYECVVFHMTDLPYGRGGSPLQNLIVRGHTETKISALKVVKELDAGPIYLKRDLHLNGTAEEIFIRANSIIELMILEITSKDIEPKAQEGDIVKFNRRKTQDSNISDLEDLKKTYDYIRMLDAKGYPYAFIETPHLKLEFTNASFNKDDKIITANVRIFKK